MSDFDIRLRRRLLGPLVHGEKELVDEAALSQALDRLLERGNAKDALDDLRPHLKKGWAQHRRGWRQGPEQVREFIALTKLLYASRNITTAQYVFFASSIIEGVHNERLLAGEYSSALQAVDEEMRAIEKFHGLAQDEFWPAGEGPEDWNRLDEDYTAILDTMFVEVLREYEFEDLADLRQTQPERFDHLRERGRRSVFHQNEIELALRDVALRYEEEAARAASTRAYTAAIICLGSAAEALLVLRCYRSPVKASRIAEGLPTRLRVKKGRDPNSWPFSTLVEVCLQAGWLPKYQTEYGIIDSSGVADHLRRLRNYVHPGRLVKERAWLEADERDYDDARAFYAVVAKALGRVGGRRQSQRRAPAGSRKRTKS